MYIYFTNTAPDETSGPNISTHDIYADIIRLISINYISSSRVKL